MNVATDNKEARPLLEVRDLKKYFPIHAGFMQRKVADVKAVDGISFSIKRGETFGLVGESGCGKSTTGRAVLQLQKPTSGNVRFDGQDLAGMSPSQLRSVRKHMQLIFQDPYASLDPRMPVGDIVGEPLVVHGLAKGSEYKERIANLFAMVELDPAMTERYPHEFSGGQRQRVGIARALASEPSFIVCDEPISALDVSVAAQITNLFIRLRNELNLTYLFIAHDLSVVRNVSDRIAVMYLGRVVEIIESELLNVHALHPYTKSLLSAVPVPDPVADRKRERILLKGEVPSPVNPPSGCTFHTRCPMATDLCRNKPPELKPHASGQWVSCHHV